MGGQGTEIAEHNPIVSIRLQPDPKGPLGWRSVCSGPQGGKGICIWPQERAFQSSQLRTLQPFQGAEWGMDTPTEESAEEHGL